VRRWLWDGLVITRAQAAEVVESSLATFASRRFGFWTIEPAGGSSLLGVAGLRPLEETPEDVELFYGLEPEHWGRGYATEASRAVLAHGFAVGLPRVLVRTDGPNLASVRVMERLGLRYVRTDPTGAFGTTIVYVAEPPPAG
jgi:RimJ/RimL family protein N-acetyltransferase